MRKRIILFLSVLCLTCFLFSVNVFASDVVESGTCGTNLTWSLDDEGVLTISGEGKMANYSEDSTAPWYSQRTQIKNVVIEDGVTLDYVITDKNVRVTEGKELHGTDSFPVYVSKRKIV